MPVLEWDKVGDKSYESGLDHGVLYLPDGRAIPWNGLTSVTEDSNNKTNEVYFDGKKINTLLDLGDFSATMKAFTYPDEFVELEGALEFRPGMFAMDQMPKVFGLSYRTRIGNDLDGEEAGYKIHLVYNATAIPSSKSYASVADSSNINEFEWKLTAIPDEIPGLRPTAHMVFDTRKVDPLLIGELEDILYGSDVTDAGLIPMPDLVSRMYEWFRIKIRDNGDGTWTATTRTDSLIVYDVTDPGSFTLIDASAVYLSDDEFVISDTRYIADVPEVKIHDNLDGTWTASSSNSALISISPDGSFEVRDATVVVLDADTYQLSDTA